MSTADQLGDQLAMAISVVVGYVEGTLDPSASVPCYDLHERDGRHTGYCLVRNEWLDELWNGYTPASIKLPMLPHEHVDPSTAYDHVRTA